MVILMGFNGDLMGFNGDLMGYMIYDGLPSGKSTISMERSTIYSWVNQRTFYVIMTFTVCELENCPVEILEIHPLKTWWIFPVRKP
jgi:hypothetical protein